MAKYSSTDEPTADWHESVTVEPDPEEVIKQAKTAQTTALASTTRKKTAIANLMDNDKQYEHVEHVKYCLDEYNELQVKYQEAYSYHVGLISDRDVLEREANRYSDRNEEITAFRTHVMQWIKTGEQYEKPGIAASENGSHETLEDVQVRLAELRVEKDSMAERWELERRLEMLKMETEISKTTAREKTLLMNRSGDLHINKLFEVDNELTHLSPSSQSMPPPSQGMPPPSQSLYPSSQGMAPTSQGMPLPSQGMASTSQGMPPPSQGLYPSSQGMPPPSQGMPPPSQGLYSSSQGMPPTSQGMPPQPQGLYPSSQGLYPSSQGMPPPSQGLYSSSQGMPPTSQGMPPPSQGLYPSSQGMPPTPQDMPPPSQDMHPPSQSLYPSSQGMPPTSHSMLPPSQGMASTSQGMPLPSQGLYPSSQGMPPTSQGMPPPSQSLYPSSQGMPPTSHGMLPPSQGMVPVSHGMPPTYQGMLPSSQRMVSSVQSMRPSHPGMPPSSQGMLPSAQGIQPPFQSIPTPSLLPAGVPLPQSTLPYGAVSGAPPTNYTSSPSNFMTDPFTYLANQQLAFQQLATAVSLPQTEITKFEGNPMEFHTFMNAFDSRIMSRVCAECDKLHYLHQMLKGEPKELIGGSMHMDPTTGYQNARFLLYQEYGNPYKVTAAYMNKLLSWPVVKYDDCNALKSYSLFLTKCYYASLSINELVTLNNPPNMQHIVLKLPSYLQNKWRETVARPRDQGVVPTFSDLVNFVHRASDAVNDPVYSKQALYVKTPSHVNDKQHPKSNSGHKRNVTGSFATDVNNNSSVSFKKHVPVTAGKRNNRPTGNYRTFVVCQGQHDLDVCT